MYSTVFLLLFIAFYLLYNLSERVVLKNKSRLLAYFGRRIWLTRTISLLLTLIASFLLIWRLGTGAGIFSIVLVLMACGSLIVVLSPLQYFRLRHLLVFYGCLIAFEIFVF